MSLVRCPECGSDYEAYEDGCAHCGCPKHEIGYARLTQRPLQDWGIHEKRIVFELPRGVPVLASKTMRGLFHLASMRNGDFAWIRIAEAVNGGLMEATAVWHARKPQ